MTHHLVLCDVAGPALDIFVAELERESSLTGHAAGDTCDKAVLAKLAEFLSSGEPFILVHAAGVSPSLADWETIIRVNLQGTALILQALEAYVVPGTVSLLISSIAGHGLTDAPELEEVMADALDPDLVARTAPCAIAAEAGREWSVPSATRSASWAC